MNERAVAICITLLICACLGLAVAVAHLSALPERIHCPAPAELIWYPQTETVACEP